MKKKATGTRRRTSKRKPASQRVRPHFVNPDADTVEPDFQFWVIHAVHWVCLFVAAVGILTVGVTLFSGNSAALAFGP